MLQFESFEFSGDQFYQKHTQVPLDLSGLTLLRGKNLDADASSSSNGAGKSRLPQVLEGFIFAKNPRGNFKKTVLPTFTGTLKFKDHKGDYWSFSYTPKEAVGAWTICKNDQIIKVSHKPSDNLETLQKTLGVSREDWNYFVCINQNSLNILMRGKPTERKAYLEGFFNIDTFYTTKFEEYNTKWKKLKDEIEIIKNDRIRLDTINAARRDLPGHKRVELQLESSDEVLAILKAQISQDTEKQTELKNQIGIWQQYHALFTQLQGLDIKALKEEQDLLVKTKIELEIKAKNRLQLESFLETKFAPHQLRRPRLKTQQPTVDKPDSKEVTAKEIALTQMREKLRLKKQITPLIKEVSDLKQQLETSDLSTLEKQKVVLYKQRLDLEEHHALLCKGGDACPTCKQPLTFILDGQTPKERKISIEAKIKEIKEQEKDYLKQITLHTQLAKLTQQLDVLQEQFARYPTFGMKLSDAEQELLDLKALVMKWESYAREQELDAKWQATNDLLLTEARGLGYPDILDEDHREELKKIAARLPSLLEEIKLFDRFDVLTEAVLLQEPLTVIEEKEKSVWGELVSLFSKVDAINEHKGVLRTYLTNIVALKSQAEVVEKRLSKQETTENECKVIGLLNDFYSPTGFKVYELKKRCQKLIERANIWSRLFFNEPYDWTMSEDMDNLDFLIRPTHDPDTEAYPISLLSSGEYNRAARVLLFSQLELIPPNKNTNLLFLDEIEGNLDEAGMTAFVEVVLPKLKETFPDKTIVVISHQSSLANTGHLDHMWLVERKNRKSTLTVYPNYQRRRS